MLKRTIFGVTLAPLFATCVAVTAYAITGGHPAAAAVRSAVAAPCAAAEAVQVQRPDAARQYELKSDRPRAIIVAPAPAPRPRTQRHDRTVSGRTPARQG